MNSAQAGVTFVAFLRGINVGGHHKVPMAELRKQLDKLGYENIRTLLNSGNIIFDAPPDKPEDLEVRISTHLEKYFGFSIPTMVRSQSNILELFHRQPFSDVTVTKEIRRYISFLRKNNSTELDIPWSSDDGSYQIKDRISDCVLSVLDLAVSKTPKAMSALERIYGKDITTRNWNTIERIVKKF